MASRSVTLGCMLRELAIVAAQTVALLAALLIAAAGFGIMPAFIGLAFQRLH